MPGDFIDSNVLLYLASDDPAKADRAEQIVRDGGTISVQILNECANVARRKQRFTWGETQRFLSMLRSLLSVEAFTIETHDVGLKVAERYQLSVYDAMIVASALLAKCDRLWSEDMHDGLVIENGPRIVNPFRIA